MMTLEQFLVGAFLIISLVIIVMGQFVMRPRLKELMEERDHWRDRAIELEDNADTGDRDSVTVFWENGKYPTSRL